MIFIHLRSTIMPWKLTRKPFSYGLDKGLLWSDKGDALKALGRTSESDAAYARASELGFGNSTSTRGTTTISPTQASTLTVCPSGCDYTSIQTAVYAASPMIQLKYIAVLIMRA